MTGDFTEVDFEDQARIYKALSHPARLTILHRFREGETNLTRISDQVGVSRPALQNHVEKLDEVDLIRRPEGTKNYSLTPIGEKIVETELENIARITRLVQEAADAEREAEEEFSDVRDQMVEAGINTQEVESKIEEKKWEIFNRTLEPVQES